MTNDDEERAQTGDEVLILPPATHKGKSGICTRSTDHYCHFLPGHYSLPSNMSIIHQEERKAVHKYVRVIKTATRNPKADVKTPILSRKGSDKGSTKLRDVSDLRFQSITLALTIMATSGINESDLEDIVESFAQMTIFHGKRILALQHDEIQMNP